MTKKTVTAKSKKHLKALIREAIKKDGYKCDLNFIDVSQVTDMSELFDFNSDNDFGKFNGDISKWNVSNVTDMSRMFSGSEFNGDISKWDVSSVTDMYRMFNCSEFNGDISKWNLAKLKNRRGLFYGTKVPFFPDKSIQKSIPKKVVAKSKKHLRKLIEKAINEKGWEADLNFIDVSKITDMSRLFSSYPNNDLAAFNGDISKWDVSNVTEMNGMFENSKFNGDISKWDVSSVTDMGGMFSNSCFNGDITLSAWDGSVRKKAVIALASRSQTDFLRDDYFTVFRNLAGKMRSSSRYLATVRRATFIPMRIKASVIAWSESGAEESSLATRSLMESKIFAEPTALPSS